MYAFRDKTCTWHEAAGNNFSSLEDLQNYILKIANEYTGKKVFCGVSMGGSAAIYFGCSVEGAHIIAASPQMFQFQFLWNTTSRRRYEMIERIPYAIRAGIHKSINLFVCENGKDQQWDWKDDLAAEVSERSFKINVKKITCSGHASWLYFSMKDEIERIVDKSIFSGGGE